jgi:hypothetical protein
MDGEPPHQLNGRMTTADGHDLACQWTGDVVQTVTTHVVTLYIHTGEQCDPPSPSPSLTQEAWATSPLATWQATTDKGPLPSALARQGLPLAPQHPPPMLRTRDHPASLLPSVPSSSFTQVSCHHTLPVFPSCDKKLRCHVAVSDVATKRRTTSVVRRSSFDISHPLLINYLMYDRLSMLHLDSFCIERPVQTDVRTSSNWS